ncbi:EamA family transporter [Nocardioides sp. CPCC 205120]|uniref:EamA family transporter n=1 Tax=Nocardioides sp. CPCC 205120 TaxID=3406462 RepID=UPI003B50E60B
MASVEDKLRRIAVTAVAPVAWGSTYVVTRQLLPADAPLWGAALRALPAGLVLLLLARSLPRGAWWWRSAVLGVLNVGAFFVLVYVAAQRLPSSVASVVMALAPLVLLGTAWAVDAARPTLREVLLACVGAAGVVGIVRGAVGGVDGPGLLASAAALALSSLGFVLARRWSRRDTVPVVASTAWQLVAGGGALLVVAAVAEGAPPTVDVREGAGFAYVALVATALAFWCWFAGLARLDVATVGLVGLLNPVAGVLLGTAVAGERLAPVQVAGVLVVLGAVGFAAVGRERRPTPLGQTGSSPAAVGS